MAEPSEKLLELVGRMPDPDDRGMYCTNIDKEKIEAAIAEIHKGGTENIIGVIDMLVEPGRGDDVKAHYALHCIGLYVCKLGEDARSQFGEALVSQLGGNRPKAVQKYLIEELQAFGGREAVEKLGSMLTDEDLCEPAAMALVAIRRGARRQFREALGKVKGRSKLTIIQNLGVLRDRRSVGELTKAAEDDDQDVRIAATWGLANIGDAGSADLLIRIADNSSGWERIQATKACLMLAEKLIAAGQKTDAARTYKHFQETRSDPGEQYIKDLAADALASVG
ncbi:MAG: HEAT repeat domain-containing protein [Sedimentisphaerales bacterium]|nr:HEAT repeat domain-containing protein [Sedimentisphaerales bacterium]